MSFLSPPPSSLLPPVLPSEPITSTFEPLVEAGGRSPDTPSALNVLMFPLSRA